MLGPSLRIRMRKKLEYPPPPPLGVMHDTISTDETPQNENAASRSARHDITHSR